MTAYRKERNVQETWATHDRVMVCISPDQSSLRLMRRGWRIAQRLHAEHRRRVCGKQTDNARSRSRYLRNDFALADRLKVPVVTLHGDVANEIIRYARENQITQIVIGHSDRTRWQEFVKGSIINKLTFALRNVDILIVASSEEG